MAPNNKKVEIEKRIREQLDAFKIGSVELIKEEELYKKLLRYETKGIPLKVKAGFDPTSPDIHLGHTVLLNKLRVFQEFGHRVLFIIGDFTAMIGDPTGKSETRKPLSEEEVLRNSRDYKEQAFKILKPESTKIIFNSWWLSNIKLGDFIKISSNYTVRRMLEKDDFEKRYNENRPIAMHEFIYPLLQGMDSVFLESDVEIGGNDQKFNLIVGRELMKSYDMEPQVIMTMPLLEGLDGKNKMSKSLGNAIGVSDEPNEMFGKIMSISDEMMMKYYELLSSLNINGLNDLKARILDGLNPIIAKKELALDIVGIYWGKPSAEKALNYFEERFQKRINPDDIETIEVVLDGGINIPELLTMDSVSACATRGEVKRLIKQGGIKITFQTECKGDSNKNAEIKLDKDNLELPVGASGFIVKVGKKKIFKIKIK